MRALDIIAIHAAGSGHPGGTLSIMDVCAVLFLSEARIDPENPDWEERDRIFFSAGHKAPAIYVSLAKAGFYGDEEVVTLRKLNSKFQGHPHAESLPGLEVSSGSLGQGLGIASGCALNARLDNKPYRAYCILGDGEHQEGSVWEAIMFAGHHKLDNLCAIIDKNELQIDGLVKNVLDIDPIGEKYRAFNWNVIEIDGHDINQIITAFKEARNCKGKPSVIIAKTIKGKGVSFMENNVGWHGVATKGIEQLTMALVEINSSRYTIAEANKLLGLASVFGTSQHEAVIKQLPAFSKNYWWNSDDIMKVEMEPTRFGFGRGLETAGDDPRVVTLHADISDSIKISDFEKGHSDRNNRVFSVGIAEQNMMQVAAGFALEGKIPVTGTYGVFASGRAWDQIRTTICYDNLNVKIGGAHGGISVGADGATHQALEEISLMSILPNMNLFVPCDSVETERITKLALLNIQGPAYIRFGREATPIGMFKNCPLEYGKANIIRYREKQKNFRDAFETILASEYENESEVITFISCGPITLEAMRAAYILKEDFNIESRILNIHTVKPIDNDAIIRAASETEVILVCEEHQVGGFGNIVAGAINKNLKYNSKLLFDMIGVDDHFGESGDPWDLMIKLKLTAEFIVNKANELLLRKN